MRFGAVGAINSKPWRKLDVLERVVLVPEYLDLSALAEAITYYGNVEAVYGSGHLADLVEKLGIDGAIRLAESDLVTFLYRRSIDAVHTDDSKLYPHSFSAISLHATAEGMKINGPVDQIAMEFTRRFGAGSIRRRDVTRLVDALYVREESAGAIGKGALSDISDQALLQACLRRILQIRVPDYPKIDSISAIIRLQDDRFHLDSNIDFNLANHLYRARVPPEHSTITPAYLIVPFLTMRSEMFYSGDRNCDLWAEEIHSELLRTKVNGFISRLEGGKKSIDRFEEFVFAGRSFSQAVANGERSVLDVLNFAEEDETRKFKAWIKDGPEGADLLAEYEKSKVLPSKMAASLPAKVSKIFLFSAAGAVIEGAVGGAGWRGALVGNLVGDTILSIADQTLLSRLKLGWRPNQWVANSAGPFLRG